MKPIIPLITPLAAPILPESTFSELNDRSLFRLLQQIVVQITGIDATKVFPRWQAKPANQPDFDVNWAAVGETERMRDAFPAVIHATDPASFNDSADYVVRNQIIGCLASFYGTDAEAYSELFSMGLFLEQNRLVISANGFALVDVADSIMVPFLSKERWLRGVDVAFRLRRQQIYEYPVANLQYVEAKLEVDSGVNGIITEDCSVEQGDAQEGVPPDSGS